MDFLRKKVESPEPGHIEPGHAEPGLVGPDLTPAEPGVPPPPGQNESNGPLSPADLLSRSRHLFNLYGGLIVGFLVFYALADYTAYTTAQQRPGQLIFSNTMTQLWTACFRLAFILGASLGLLRLFWPELFRFFRSDSPADPDMINTIRFELTSFQRLCVFLLAFFGLCFLFVLLLSVSLPETISVGR